MVSNRVMINEDKKKIFVGFLFAMLLAISMIVLHERSITKQSHIGFTLYAYFNKIDGVANGVEVRLGGLKVGRVVSQTFAKDYQIKVEMALNKDYQLPVDSSVQIETDGLMGPKHIEIVPGADDELLRDGDAFGYTQDVMILNDLLEKVVAYMRDKKGVTDEEESN
ncbi:MAG: MCE family protein [Alphaproteobacteria bacterium]|nr:MCE family protein [Alphaproteobacteria bacterium]